MISNKLKVFILLLVPGCLLLVTATQSHALNLDKANEYFLKGDYENSITECEKILAQGKRSKDLDELYFLLGLSYMKSGDYLRSYDVFQIIIEEFPASRYKEQTLLGQADIDFLKSDYYVALIKYKQAFKLSTDSELKPAIYLRLVKASLKNGYWQDARLYTEKLKNDYPVSPETFLAKSLLPEDFYFTVQVGAFSKKENANKLRKELIEEGYAAFIQDTDSRLGKFYRVRVGKLEDFNDAIQLEAELKAIGYPSKIYP
jgi:tetratricopeptide (TPR) repeat protein